MLQQLTPNKEKQQKLNQELIEAIKNKKDLSIIEEIIKKGADVNCADKYSKTPLYHACEEGLTEVALTLIAKGVDVNCADKNGQTPIQFAIKRNHMAVINLLEEKIKQETKDLIAKIQEKKIKERDETQKSEALKSKKIQQEVDKLKLKAEEIQAQNQQFKDIQKKQQEEIEIKQQQDEEIKKQLSEVKEQQELQKIDQEKLKRYLQKQRKLIDDNKQHIDSLKSAIDQQLTSSASANINPRFLMTPQDLAEIKYIQNNPELKE